MLARSRWDSHRKTDLSLCTLLLFSLKSSTFQMYTRLICTSWTRASCNYFTQKKPNDRASKRSWASWKGLKCKIVDQVFDFIQLYRTQLKPSMIRRMIRLFTSKTINILHAESVRLQVVGQTRFHPEHTSCDCVQYIACVFVLFSLHFHVVSSLKVNALPKNTLQVQYALLLKMVFRSDFVINEFWRKQF